MVIIITIIIIIIIIIIVILLFHQQYLDQLIRVHILQLCVHNIHDMNRHVLKNKTLDCLILSIKLNLQN